MIMPEKSRETSVQGLEPLNQLPTTRYFLPMLSMILPVFSQYLHLLPEREYLMIHQMARTPSFQLIFLPSA
jgi:hypothetical protein